MSPQNNATELLMIGFLLALSVIVIATSVTDVPGAFAQDVGYSTSKQAITNQIAKDFNTCESQSIVSESRSIVTCLTT